MKLLRNLRIRTKLSILLVAALGGLGVFAIVAFTTLGRVKINGEMYHSIIAKKDLLADVLPPPHYIIESYLVALEITHESDQRRIDSLVETSARLTREYKARQDHWFQHLEEGEMRDVLFNGAIPAADEFFALRDDKLIPAARAGKRDEAVALMTGPVRDAYERHRVAIDRIVQLTVEQAAAIEGQAATAVSNGTRGIVVAAGALTLIVLAVVVVIGSDLSREIKRVVAMLEALATGEGDLTKRLNLTRGDEIGQLARWFDSFMERLRTMIAEIASIGGQVAGAATEIAASSEEMATGLNEQALQTTRVSASTEEMASTSDEVAQKSADGKSVVEQTVREIDEIAQEVTASAQVVGELGRKGDEIGKIIAVINDIADQTNLLALNAAIEAARAGEHGRGFAVVADEVRKLAERTTKATEQVGSSIKEIQSGTSAAVQRMDSGAARVKRGVDLARSAGDALTSIVASAQRQASAVSEIAQNIEQINAVSQQSTEGAAQAAAAAATLSGEAERLQSLVGRFRV